MQIDKLFTDILLEILWLSSDVLNSKSSLLWKRTCKLFKRVYDSKNFQSRLGKVLMKWLVHGQWEGSREHMNAFIDRLTIENSKMITVTAEYFMSIHYDYDIIRKEVSFAWYTLLIP
jgi:hypothetical protein